MRILEDFKSSDYWVKVLQLGTVFFVIFVGPVSYTHLTLPRRG